MILKLGEHPNVTSSTNNIGDHYNHRTKRLSGRHIDVLQLIAKGLTSAEIAKRLGISTTTVITHRRNLMRTLGLHSAAELTSYAIKNRIVSN